MLLLVILVGARTLLGFVKLLRMYGFSLLIIQVNFARSHSLALFFTWTPSGARCWGLIKAWVFSISIFFADLHKYFILVLSLSISAFVCLQSCGSIDSRIILCFSKASFSISVLNTSVLLLYKSFVPAEMIIMLLSSISLGIILQISIIPFPG
uniref:Uncharacterized protein n=1 Tax=Cacopsylla melanoneura TaxID=428564 RepID=A0A8D8TJT4_9HEMI